DCKSRTYFYTADALPFSTPSRSCRTFARVSRCGLPYAALHPVLCLNKPSVSFSQRFLCARRPASSPQANGGSSGGASLRRALVAAAFSSANGGCCIFLFIGERRL
ncbi:unnamed protein product, partial [Musa textilis]